MTRKMLQNETKVVFPEPKKPGFVNRMRKIPCLGIFFALLYAFFMSSAVTLVKLTKMNPVEIFVFRSIIQLIVFGLIAVYRNSFILGLKSERLCLIGRAVSGVANQCSWYISVKKISLTDSSAIYYSAPVFVALLAHIFLKEPFGLFEILSIIVTVSGVILISRPSFIPIFGNETSIDGEHVEGLLYALTGALTFALSNIFLRKLQKTSFDIIALWFSFISIIFGALYVFILDSFRSPVNLFEWLIILLSGFSGVLGNIAFVIALKIEKAGPVSVAQTLNIVIVLIYQILFFNEPISINTLFGALLIGLSVIVTGLKDIILSPKLIERFKNITSNTISWNVDNKSSNNEVISMNGKYIPCDSHLL